MANFDTGRDLLANVLARADELGIGSSDRETEARAYIQAAYISVVEKAYPCNWAKKNPPGVLVVSGETTAGSVTVTKGSAIITFSSAPSASLAGQKFFIDADPVVYRIATNVSPFSTATLDVAYLGDTKAGQAYHVFQDEYDLASDFLAPWGKRFLRDQHGRFDVDLIGEDELTSRYYYPWRGTSVTRYCALIGDQRLRIAPWTTDPRRYEYGYAFKPAPLDFSGASATDSTIIKPTEDNIVIAFYAVANLLVDKNDDRAQVHAAAAESKLSDMRRFALKKMHIRSFSRAQFSIGAAR